MVPATVASNSKGDETATHKILTLFRADKDHPMGAKGVEIAYEIHQENGEITNWLIFQLEMVASRSWNTVLIQRYCPE